MPLKTSAGLLLYRFHQGQLEVFLAHPGGPFFARKDAGVWTIPKGEIEPGEAFLATAIREFKEEVGLDIDSCSRFLDLGSIRQKGGKTVHAWGIEHAGLEPVLRPSSYFEVEWPPRSGRRASFPEVDQARFFPLEEARRRIKDAQRPLLDRLEQALARNAPPG